MTPFCLQVIEFFTMASAAASALPELGPTRHFVCPLTGDRLFSDAHAHEIVSDGVAYRVRGNLDEGLAALSLDTQFTLGEDGELPLSVIDVVRWSGLRHVQLDKPGFIKHWQRYIGALQQHVQAKAPKDGGGEEGASALLLRAHEFARRLMHGFDELDFLVGASESKSGPVAIVHYLDEDPLTPYIYFLCEGAMAVSPDAADGTQTVSVEEVDAMARQ